MLDQVNEALFYGLKGHLRDRKFLLKEEIFITGRCVKKFKTYKSEIF